MPSPLGSTPTRTSSPSRARPAASASPPSAAPRRPATSCAGPQLPGCAAHGDELTYVSLGEGACSEGEFWESLNTACTLHLPVLFVVADNGYAISVPAADQPPAPVAELVRGLPRPRRPPLRRHRLLRGARRGRGRSSSTCAPASVRRSSTPTSSGPYSHSAADTQSKYRTAEELADEAAHDPIDAAGARRWSSGGVLTPRTAAAHPGRGQGDRGQGRGRGPGRARRPDPATVTEHVVRAARTCRRRRPSTDEGGEPVPFGEAIKRTLHEQMAADERIRVFGEDVADAREAVLADVEGKGGVFGTTHGLQRAFGQARCFNTPLAEANIVGRAVGQAIRGLRPAPEIQFFDYIWPAMQQIKSEAATIRWRSNGAFTCPMVMRVPIGGYLTGGAIWHSQCGESIFAHVPGLLIAFPSRARDAAGPAALRVPLRGPGAVPRAQAPAAPALHRRPVPAAPTT